MQAGPAFHFVIRIGFEPMTYCLEGSCSIQLSYRTNNQKQKECGERQLLFLILFLFLCLIPFLFLLFRVAKVIKNASYLCT
jgi:hypothetical protein